MGFQTLLTDLRRYERIKKFWKHLFFLQTDTTPFTINFPKSVTDTPLHLHYCLCVRVIHRNINRHTAEHLLNKFRAVSSDIKAGIPDDKSYNYDPRVTLTESTLELSYTEVQQILQKKKNYIKTSLQIMSQVTPFGTNIPNWSARNSCRPKRQLPNARPSTMVSILPKAGDAGWLLIGRTTRLNIKKNFVWHCS